MKLIFFILTLCFVTLAFAKRDVDFSIFNEAVNENIDHVIEHNPQSYEESEGARAPASVEIEDEIQEDTAEKMNAFDQQHIGKDEW